MTLLLWRVWRKSRMRTCCTFYSIFTSKPVHYSTNNMGNRKTQLNWKGDIWIRKRKHLTLWHPLPSCSPSYYANTTSSKHMKDVLVITLPRRNYTEESTSALNNTVSIRARQSSTCIFLKTVFDLLSVKLADKWLCGGLPRRGSALWQSAKREDAQSAKSTKQGVS